MSERTSPFTIFLVQVVNTFFRITSLVGSTTLSMTYSINVRPYNDPYIKIVEEAMEAISGLLNPGSYIVDIIPILKYVPEWFPGAKFQIKAAVMREHAEKMRNTTFLATEKLMVCDSFTFPRIHIDNSSQASTGSGCDPSFVTEGIREVQYSSTPNQDINRLKDVAVAAYIG